MPTGTTRTHTNTRTHTRTHTFGPHLGPTNRLKQVVWRLEEDLVGRARGPRFWAFGFGVVFDHKGRVAIGQLSVGFPRNSVLA